MDITPLLALLKGKGTDNFKAVLEGMKMVNDEIRIQYNEIKDKNKELEKKVEEIVTLEAECLKRNVEANELIKNLCEWIIFEERRSEIKNNLKEILK